MARDSSKISAFVPQEHQIKMRSDESKDKYENMKIQMKDYTYHT